MNLPSADYWVVSLIGFAITLALLRMIAARTGDWLTYAHLFSVLWGVNLLVCQIGLGGLLRPEIVTVAVLFCAWWMFLVGARWTIRSRPERATAQIDIRRSSAIAILVMLILAQCLAVAFELRSLQLDLGSVFGDFFRTGPELRVSGMYSTIEYPFSFSIWRWGHVLYIPLALMLHSKKMISGKVLAVTYVLASVMAFGRYTRAPLIQLAVCSFVGWMVLYRPAARMRFAIGAGVAILATTVFVATQVNLAGLDAPSQLLPSESMFGYIGGSPRAYESLLKGEFARDGSGYYSLESFNYLLFRLSIIGSYPGLTRPYADIPLATNVFTFLDAYTLDFGILGALFGSFITGAVGGWFYSRLVSRPNYVILVVYCYFAYGCVMAVANNEFIRIGFPIAAAMSFFIDLMIRTRAIDPVGAVLLRSRRLVTSRRAQRSLVLP